MDPVRFGRSLWIGLWLSLVPLLAPAGAQARGEGDATQGQRIEGTVLRDRDFRFELRLPGPSWSFLPERKAKQLVPDSVAGMRYSKKGRHLFGAVVVERIGDTAIEDLFELILDNLGLEDAEVVRRGEAVLGGRKALRATIRGRFNDLRLRYRIHLVANQGFAYQFVSWHVDGAGFDELLDQFAGAIGFLSGPVRVRANAEPRPDDHGVGWRIRDNRYQGALTGLGIAPSKGWRLVTGVELQQMADDSEVGLIHVADEIYLVTNSDPMGVVDAELVSALETRLHDQYGPAERAVRVTCLGEERKLHVSSGNVGGLPMTYVYGGFQQGDRYRSVLAWFGGKDPQGKVAKIATELGGWTQATARQLEPVRTELASAEDRDTAAGSGYSLYGGVFRDFEHKLTWTKPKAGYWQAHTGTPLKELDEEARFGATELESGITFMLLPQRVGDGALDDYHKAVVTQLMAALENPSERSTQTVEWLGGEGQSTRVDCVIDGMPSSVRIASARRGSLGIRLVAFGWRAQQAALERILPVAMNGLRLAPDLQAVEQTKARYLNRRMGFALDLVPHQPLKDQTPAAYRAAGTTLFTGRSGGAMIFGALHPPTPVGPDWIADTVFRNFGNILRARSFTTDPTQSPATFLGRPGTRFVWQSDTKREVEAYATNRGGIWYFAFLLGTKKNSRAMLESVELLD